MYRCVTISTGRRIWSRLQMNSWRGYRRRRRAFLMRILFCNKYNFPFSGTEVYLFEVMKLLRSHGHKVALFSMADSRGETTPYHEHFVSAIDFKQECGFWKKGNRAGH